MFATRARAALPILFSFFFITSGTILAADESPIVFIAGEAGHAFATLRADTERFKKLPCETERKNEHVRSVITTLFKDEYNALPFFITLPSSDGIRTVHFPLASYRKSELFAQQVKEADITAEDFIKLYLLLHTYDFNKLITRSAYIEGSIKPALEGHTPLFRLAAYYVENCDHMKKHGASMAGSPRLYEKPLSSLHHPRRGSLHSRHTKAQRKLF